MARPKPAIEAAEGGVRVLLRVAPKAARTSVQGVAEGADGRMVLRLPVTAAPEGGKANAAVLALLSKAWRVPKSSIDIVAGGADRSKVLFVRGEPGELAARLTAWADALPR